MAVCVKCGVPLCVRASAHVCVWFDVVVYVHYDVVVCVWGGGGWGLYVCSLVWLCVKRGVAVCD